MLLDKTQPIDKLEQIIMAMSVHHGLQNPELQRSIQSSIQALIAQRPEAGVLVARQFALRADWSQSPLLEPLVQHRQLASLQDLLTVSVYLARAREAADISGGALNE